MPFSFPWIIYSIRGELEGFVAFGRIALLLHSNKQRGLETREKLEWEWEWEWECHVWG